MKLKTFHIETIIFSGKKNVTLGSGRLENVAFDVGQTKTLIETPNGLRNMPPIWLRNKIGKTSSNFDTSINTSNNQMWKWNSNEMRMYPSNIGLESGSKIKISGWIVKTNGCQHVFWETPKWSWSCFTVLVFGQIGRYRMLIFSIAFIIQNKPKRKINLVFYHDDRESFKIQYSKRFHSTNETCVGPLSLSLSLWNHYINL